MMAAIKVPNVRVEAQPIGSPWWVVGAPVYLEAMSGAIRCMSWFGSRSPVSRAPRRRPRGRGWRPVALAARSATGGPVDKNQGDPSLETITEKQPRMP
jgi:hypothetical protein